ncbi:unnamed protein product [Bursaphelenchus okinawaensis]|uniref:Uncharacterized protein n=1 Tax=Bursaphelenchus okinawaensis TaxID=465554 RepID=A0A811L0N2_9BILA|nr:unnamed protein product [Bursaphelenchus okinawaensis]CAG9115554.1 unnamed protein product [Bursaphelenchus okinawaensis]
MDTVKRRLCCCLYKDRQAKYSNADAVQYDVNGNNTVVITQPIKTNGFDFHDVGETPRTGNANSGFEDDGQEFDEINLDDKHGIPNGTRNGITSGTGAKNERYDFVLHRTNDGLGDGEDKDGKPRHDSKKLQKSNTKQDVDSKNGKIVSKNSKNSSKNGRKNDENNEVTQVTSLMLDDIYGARNDKDDVQSEEYTEPENNVVTSASEEDIKFSQTAGVHRFQIDDDADNSTVKSTSATSKPVLKVRSNEETVIKVTPSHEDTVAQQKTEYNERANSNTNSTVLKNSPHSSYTKYHDHPDNETQKDEYVPAETVLKRAAYLNKLPSLDDDPIIVTATDVRSQKSGTSNISPESASRSKIITSWSDEISSEDENDEKRYDSLTTKYNGVSTSHTVEVRDTVSYSSKPTYQDKTVLKASPNGNHSTVTTQATKSTVKYTVEPPESLNIKNVNKDDVNYDEDNYIITDHEAVINSSVNTPTEPKLSLHAIREESKDSSDKDTTTPSTSDRSRPNVSMYGELNEESSDEVSTGRSGHNRF